MILIHTREWDRRGDLGMDPVLSAAKFSVLVSSSPFPWLALSIAINKLVHCGLLYIKNLSLEDPVCVLIESWLTSWNHGAFDKLVYYSYKMATGYLGKAHRNQNTEQHHFMFLIIVLRGKLCKTISFFANWNQGGWCNLTKCHRAKRVLWMKSLHRSRR